MKKLAIFVEGQTEQIFVKKLLEEIAGKDNVSISLEKLQGGARSPRSIIPLNISDGSGEVKFYVLIRDSSTDSRVLADILEQGEELIDNGYEKIIGLRDLFPKPVEELANTKTTIARLLERFDFPVSLIIAVREIETWFIGEDAHFSNICETLTTERILNELNVNLEEVHAEDIEEPANFLNSVYQLSGKAYRKTKAHVNRTVETLDIDKMYMDMVDEYDSLGELIGEIDSFLVVEAS